MKLMLENWKRFVNENEEELDEGLASLAMDPETIRNAEIAIRAITQSVANFSPAMLGAVGAYLAGKYGGGGKPPGDFTFDTDYDSDKTVVSDEPPTKVDTSDDDRDTAEMLKNMNWGTKRPVKK
jgi:hypothetical protein